MGEAGSSRVSGAQHVDADVAPLRSTIQVRANERTAAFDALYTEQAANPLIDTIEPVRITEEPLVSSGSAFCRVNSRPRTFVLNVLSKCSSVISPSVPIS